MSHASDLPAVLAFSTVAKAQLLTTARGDASGLDRASFACFGSTLAIDVELELNVYILTVNKMDAFGAQWAYYCTMI
jgi:hypothetical protein